MVRALVRIPSPAGTWLIALLMTVIGSTALGRKYRTA
jgi:hypothetical protein